MEPKFSAPSASPERLVPSGYENTPSPRQEVERSPDLRGEIRSERPAERVPVSPQAVLPPPIATPPALPPPPVSSPASNTTDDSAMPLTAGDDDLIEKEWVEKAKKIVASTKGDPYRREQEVGRLQEDYLRKRYGKELGETL